MKSKKANKKKIKVKKLSKIIVIAIFITCVSIIISIAPNYIRQNDIGKIKIIIDNNDVTNNVKSEIYIDEKEVIYMEVNDIASFFDKNIFYDEQNNQITTTFNENTASLQLETEEMSINSSKIKVYGKATKKENNIYLPLSEMKNVYNIELNYIKESNILTIDSLYKEQKRGNASKNISIKYEPTIFSKTVDKVKKADSIIVIEELKNGWKKVRTSLGNIGYTKNVTNIYNVREEM